MLAASKQCADAGIGRCIAHTSLRECRQLLAIFVHTKDLHHFQTRAKEANKILVLTHVLLMEACELMTLYGRQRRYADSPAAFRFLQYVLIVCCLYHVCIEASGFTAPERAEASGFTSPSCCPLPRQTPNALSRRPGGPFAQHSGQMRA